MKYQYTIDKHMIDVLTNHVIKMQVTVLNVTVWMTSMCVLMEQEWFVTNWQNITTLQQLIDKSFTNLSHCWGDQLD